MTIALAIGIVLASFLLASKAHAFWPFGTSAHSFDPFVQVTDPTLVINLDMLNIKPKFIDMQPTSKVIFLPGDDIARVAGQCVGFVKYVTGLDISGNAIDWAKHINSDVPGYGKVVVIKAGRWWHIGVQVSEDAETITVRSRNWQGLWIISNDVFQKNDPRIAGYIDY